MPGIDAAKFDEIADQAKAGCPVSRVLKADITLPLRYSMLRGFFNQRRHFFGM